VEFNLICLAFTLWGSFSYPSHHTQQKGSPKFGLCVRPGGVEVDSFPYTHKFWWKKKSSCASLSKNYEGEYLT